MTGVLPVTLNDATKAVQVLLHSGKEYVCVMKLHGDVHETRIKEVLSEFEDTIFQRPPLRASVKRRVRTRKIYYLVFLERSRRNVLFQVGCEGGTYIRKLCFDIGEVLGCGAHMQELRRTRSGPFDETDSVILHDLAYSFLKWEEKENDEMMRRLIQPVEQGLILIPKIYIRDTAVDAVCHGANLTAPGVLSLESGIAKGSTVAILSLKGEAVALAKALASSKQILDLEHGFVASTERVLMQRGTYPKRWKTGEKRNE